MRPARTTTLSLLLLGLMGSGCACSGKTGGAEGPEVPAAPTIHPTLTLAVSEQERLAPTVRTHAPVPLKVTVAGPAYVYLFDELEGVATLMWKHEGPAWQAGEYESDEAVLTAPGEHKLVLVASPRPVPRIGEWKALHPDAIARTCGACEVAEAVSVVARRGVQPAGE